MESKGCKEAVHLLKNARLDWLLEVISVYRTPMIHMSSCPVKNVVPSHFWPCGLEYRTGHRSLIDSFMWAGPR